eukprot:4541068-Lingulodinium_polyedra.AAC.1
MAHGAGAPWAPAPHRLAGGGGRRSRPRVEGGVLDAAAGVWRGARAARVALRGVQHQLPGPG